MVASLLVWCITITGSRQLIDTVFYRGLYILAHLCAHKRCWCIYWTHCFFPAWKWSTENGCCRDCSPLITIGIDGDTMLSNQECPSLCLSYYRGFSILVLFWLKIIMAWTFNLFWVGLWLLLFYVFMLCCLCVLVKSVIFSLASGALNFMRGNKMLFCSDFETELHPRNLVAVAAVTAPHKSLSFFLS